MKKILFTIFFISISTAVFAHKVNIFYYAENNIMYLETYFSDGTKCRNSEILVYDNDENKILLKGITDKQGKFQFNIPKTDKKHNLKVVLNAEMGHRNEVIIKPSEWMETEQEIKNTQTEITDKNKLKDSSTNNQFQLNKKDFEKILDKKLKPVLRELALLKEEKPSFNEIFGGIGYIFGLFGIILYFKAKK
jgi:nickel transport protein